MRIKRNIKNVIALGLGVLVAKLFGIIRFRFYLNEFGRNGILDTFFASNTLIEVGANILITGIFPAILVPFFVRVKSRRELFRLSIGIFWLTGLFWLAWGVIIGIFLLLGYIAPRIVPVVFRLLGISVHGVMDYYRLLVLFAGIFYFSTFLVIIAALIYYIFQSKRKFVNTWGFSLVFSAVAALSLYPLKWLLGTNPFILPLSILLGALAGFSFNLYLFWRYIGVRPSRDILDLKEIFNTANLQRLKHFIRGASYRFLGVLFDQASIFFTTFWVATRGRGALTLYSYANSVRLLFVQIVAISIIQVFVPIVLKKRFKGRGAAREFYLTLALIFLLGFAAALFLMILGKPLLYLLFGDAARDLEILDDIYNILVAGLIFMIAQSLYIYTLRVAYGVKMYKEAVAASVIGLLGRVGFAAPLSLFMGHTKITEVYWYVLGIGVIMIIQWLYLVVKLRNVRSLKVD